MKRSYLLGLALLVFAAAPAIAETKIESGDDLGIQTGPNCDLTGYKTETIVLSAPFAIPDNGRVQVTAATLPIPNDGGLFTDVIARVKIAHTWVGDVVLNLDYYQNCGDAAPAASASLICRPRGTVATVAVPCGPNATSVGASANIGTSATNASNLPADYLFSDDAVSAIADGVNPTLVASGCFKPSTGLMSAFDGLAKGGCFSLTVSDWAGADTGSITELAISSTNEGPVATSNGTWGQLKSIYR